MKLDFSRFNNFKINNVSNNDNASSKLSFKAKPDVVSFSPVAKEKIALIKDLVSIGYTQEDAKSLIANSYNTNEFQNLVNGEYFELDGEYYPAHNINIDRNLSAIEALVYMDNDMDSYYMQHNDFGIPLGYENSNVDSENYDIGTCEFLPVELAKTMKKGFDIALSGMILKGKMDEKTAAEIQKYYDVSGDSYAYKANIKGAECVAEMIAQNLETIKSLTSDEQNDDGSLKNGLNRSLTDEEAVLLVVHYPQHNNVDELNNYIAQKDAFNYSLHDMDLNNTWNKSLSDFQKKVEHPNVVKLPKQKRKFQDLQDKLDYLIFNSSSKNTEFYEDMKALDSKKYYERLPISTLKFDATMAFSCNREQRQANIQVLNSISEELLEKMAPSKEGRKGKFSHLADLLAAKNLAEKVADLETYRLQNPQMFSFLTKEAVMDYLTSSTFYSDSKATFDYFNEVLRTGEMPEEEKSTTEVIDFIPKK